MAHWTRRVSVERMIFSLAREPESLFVNIAIEEAYSLIALQT
jgi:hypothetical protein